MITAWRLVSRARAATAFSGEGSYRYGNRWNHRGTRVVYLAATTSLAALEVLVHAGSPDHLIPFEAFRVSFPESMVSQLEKIPDDWRGSPAPESTKGVGSAWVQSGRSAVLQAPSVVVPWEFNYVVSVEHPDYVHVKIAEPVPFRFDARL